MPHGRLSKDWDAVNMKGHILSVLYWDMHEQDRKIVSITFARWVLSAVA